MSKAPIAVAPVQLNFGDTDEPTTSHQLSFWEIVAAARENAFRIALTAISMALLAALLALVLPRYYESSTRIFIDPRGLQIPEKDTASRAGSAEQAVSLVESELRVLYSDNVLRSVVEKEKLASDGEFNGEDDTFAQFVDNVRTKVKSALGQKVEEPSPELAALRYLQRAIKVRREPQSYVIDLSVTTRVAAKSQKIADRIAEEYVQTRFAALTAATQKGIDAMSGRLEELRRAVASAEDNVERYKRDNNIVGASGRLVNEQQLAELNTQLVIARNEAAKSAELIDQINRLKRAGIEPDALPEAFKSENMKILRTQFAAIRRKEASMLASLLPTHPLMRQVQRELADTRRLISDELTRVADNIRLEGERARGNERSLEKNFGDLKRLATNTNEKTVKLREFEREAEAHRSIYTAWLNRSRELQEQTRIDTALASVLSPAIPPMSAKPPSLLHLLVLGGLAGLGLGLLRALTRFRADPHLRGEQQLRYIAGSRNVLVVPRLTDVVRRQARWLAGSAPQSAVPTFAATEPGAPASVALARLSAELDARSVHEKPLIVLVTAVGDFEGKSTVAVNAALAAAAAGDRVLLIDADARGKAVSGLLPNGGGLPGLFDILAGSAQAANTIVRPQAYPLDILPAGQLGEIRSVRIAGTISGIAKPYDLVVIDGGVTMRDRHVSEFATVATQIVLVARDGVTKRAEYQSAYEILDRTGKVRPILLTDK